MQKSKSKSEDEESDDSEEDTEDDEEHKKVGARSILLPYVKIVILHCCCGHLTSFDPYSVRSTTGQSRVSILVGQSKGAEY